MKKEYDISKMKEVKNPYAGRKKAVGINLSPEVIDYFKKLAEQTTIPYQKLIDRREFPSCTRTASPSRDAGARRHRRG